MNQITAMSVDPVWPWRAHYVWVEDNEVQHRRDSVVGWAATESGVVPLRVESSTGRGVLIGTDTDPDRHLLVGVLTSGENWEDMPGMDEHVRQLIRDDLEKDDGEADQD